MTKQEAVKWLYNLKRDIGKTQHQELWHYEQALDEIIQALEQEPKIGHWIYDYEYSDWFDVTYECSCCKRTIIVPYEAKNEVYKDYPYCHCGAKMAESEDKE